MPVRPARPRIIPSGDGQTVAITGSIDLSDAESAVLDHDIPDHAGQAADKPFDYRPAGVAASVDFISGTITHSGPVRIRHE